MDKYESAQILREIGNLIELTDPVPLKGIAFHKAAKTLDAIDNLTLSTTLQELTNFPGIGKKIGAMILILVHEDHLSYYEKLKTKIPSSVVELINIPGLSIEKIRFLYENFNIRTLAELEEFLQAGQFGKIKDFGPAFVKKMLSRIATIKREGNALLYPKAYALAQAFQQMLIQKELIETIEIAGELRRKSELVHALSFVVLSDQPLACISNFANYAFVNEVLEKTSKKIRVRLKQGIAASLSIVPLEKFALNLLYCTGSENHLRALEEEALHCNYKLNSETLRPINQNTENFLKDEAAIYETLSLCPIPPELRENQGEIQAAKKNQLPTLILENDIKGVFHCHTTDSDGHNTVEEMAVAAQKRSLEYLGISDHSKSSHQANGMSVERLLNQIENIALINARMAPDFQIFSGVECDILKDGQLDFSDDILKKLDFVIISIHRFFSMDEKSMTKRMLKAIENPFTTMVGHLTGRLLRIKDPYKINISKVVDACIDNGKIMELNAYPNRLDMDWRFWIKAKEKGLKCCINPDAHHIDDLDNFKYGVNIARKGWLEKKDVINTLTLREMQLFLKKMR